MRIEARKPSPDSFLLEYWLDAINTSGPIVKLSWQLPFGKKKKVASVSWSAVAPQIGSAAVEFANAVRSAGITAIELTHDGITEERLLELWGPKQEVAHEATQDEPSSPRPVADPGADPGDPAVGVGANLHPVDRPGASA